MAKNRTFDPPLTYDEWCDAQPRGTVILSADDYRKEQDGRKAASNLLAIIHRDGGHYEAQHGTEKAAKDAVTLWYANAQLSATQRERIADGFAKFAHAEVPCDDAECEWTTEAKRFALTILSEVIGEVRTA